MPRGGRQARSGRRPTPSGLRALRGGRPAKGEPAGEAGLGSCPAWLTGDARKLWKELAPVVEQLRIPQSQDRLGFANLCQTYQEWRDCVRAVRRHGRTYETVNESGSKLVRARPEVAQGSDAQRRLVALLAEYGLTPSSRTKVKAGEERPADPIEELLARRRKGTGRGRS